MNYENMLVLKKKIGSFDAGSWLDVAVGRGDFLKFAMGSFKSWNSVAGIDNDPESLELAKHEFANTPVILVMASALSMPFTVNISIQLPCPMHSIILKTFLFFFLKLPGYAKPGGS